MLIFPATALCQSVSEKENQFVRLVESQNQSNGEKEAARALLSDLLVEDSTGIYRLANSVEQLILPGAAQTATPSTSEIQQLFQVYELGRRHDPAGPADWQIRQALLGLRYPAMFPNQQSSLLQKAVTAAPYRCPLLLYERWADWEIKAWKTQQKYVSGSGPVGSANIATAWRQISDLLYNRQIRQSNDAEEAGRLLQHLGLQMRNALPDCAAFSPNAPDKNDSKACADYLILVDLQQCHADETIWRRAFDRVVSDFPEAWMYRLAAARQFDGGDLLAAQQSYLRAEALETDPVRKAADFLRIADLVAMNGEYPQARQFIKKAMELHPDWGEPYFRLCDLYLESVEKCNFSAFDQKAIYWLAIDLCHNAQNVDTGCEEEAIDRIYRYKQLTPTPSEYAFKGLKSGDTWPLRCWMSTVTTVK